MSEPEVQMLYRELDATLKQTLRDMSNWGYIYLGRTGAGLTRSFRTETFKVGTIKACEQAKQYLGDNGVRLLEVIAIEGPRWVPYKRLEDVFYGIDPFKNASTIKNNNNKPPRVEEDKEEKQSNNNNKTNNTNNKGKKGVS